MDVIKKVRCYNSGKQGLCAHKTKNFARRIKNSAVFYFACWDAIPKSLLSSRFRDGCALLRSAKKSVFSENAQPASSGCRTQRVWEFPNKHFATQIGICIDKCTACCGRVDSKTYCMTLLAAVTIFFLNCQSVFAIAILDLSKIFRAGCHSDRTDNSNRKQILPYLR